MTKRLVLSLFLILLLSLPVIAQDGSHFESAACPVEIPFGFVEDTGAGGIECGFVDVPEFHAEPDGNRIRVAVAIINSSSPRPAADPLFMEQGGPGGSTIELFVQLAPLLQGILQQRDIILVEQRGTKYSEPNLDCPELTELAIEYIGEMDFLSEDSMSVQFDAYQTCFERLVAEGVNLSAFNSVENAADIIDVADALGYDEINFYGVSYGTMLGQHLLRDFEDRIRSIIFDAVVPLELNFVPDSIATGAEARAVLFESCAADELCNNLYPDLEATFWQTYAELNENPVLVPTIDPETGIEYEAFLNGDVLLQLLRTLQYTSEFVPSLPAFIYAAAEGDYEWVEWLYGLIAIDSGRDIADGMYTSVICAEDSDFTEADITTDNVEPQVLENQLSGVTSFPALCELGNIERLDDYVDDPVISDVPALITSGQFDPITPPRYAEVLAANLPNSTNLVFPGVGHGALLGGQCPLGIMTAFINDPQDELSTDCIDDMGVRFNEFTTDPTGQIRFPIPQGFDDVSTDEFASYENPDTHIRISLIAIDELDLDTAVNDALSVIVREGFDTPAFVALTQEGAFGDIVNNIYQDGATLILALALNTSDFTSVLVVEFPIAQVLNIDPIILPIAANLYPVD